MNMRIESLRHLSTTYYTSQNEQSTIEPLPSFDVPSRKTLERLDRTRLRQFGNPASQLTGRTSKPVSGQRTIGDKHHS